MVTITREVYPNLWAVFALVSATMGQVPVDHVTTDNSDDVRFYDRELRNWSVYGFLVLAGVTDDDVVFQELVDTEAGSFINHALNMP